jgi:23S rRNA (adenine2503-C2)-methyltransferase
LAELLGALKERFPRGGDRSVFIEYVMLKDVNDTLEDAHRLVQLMEAIQCKINLIGFNAHEGTRFLPSSREQILEFR